MAGMNLLFSSKSMMSLNNIFRLRSTSSSVNRHVKLSARMYRFHSFLFPAIRKFLVIIINTFWHFLNAPKICVKCQAGHTVQIIIGCDVPVHSKSDSLGVRMAHTFEWEHGIHHHRVWNAQTYSTRKPSKDDKATGYRKGRQTSVKGNRYPTLPKKE